jgi:hypothetical protein
MLDTLHCTRPCTVAGEYGRRWGMYYTVVLTGRAGTKACYWLQFVFRSLQGLCQAVIAAMQDLSDRDVEPFGTKP